MPLLKRKGILDSTRVMFLPLDAIEPNPDQPRKVFAPDALDELANSIRELGVLQPLTVRRQAGRWELVAGERRLRAARMAGLREVPCLSVLADDQNATLLSLVENLQRRDLDFWEEALALERLISQFQLSQEEAARRIGKSQSAVANKLRLLKLPSDVLERLRSGGYTQRHARALLPLETMELQRQAAEQVITEHLTVAQTEAMVQEMLTPREPEEPKPEPKVMPKTKRMFVLKDVRLFLNTLTHGVSLMRSAGVDARFDREDREGEILLTIHIPQKRKVNNPAEQVPSREEERETV